MLAGAVSLLPSLPDGDPALGDELERGRMRAGPCVRHVPGSELLSPGTMADTHEQQITLPDVKILRFFGGAEVFDRDAVARLEPWLSAQSGMSSSTPRPTIPSRITSIESEVAPVGVMTPTGTSS